MNNSNFIVTRFTHGSAGKFLSTLLQTSKVVDHWSETIQKYKADNELFYELTLEYVRRSFPSDHSAHVRSEPMVPYNTELYSAGFERGNEVSFQEYLNNAVVKNDVRYLDSIKHNLFANIILNKPNIPYFCYGSNVVTILVTTDVEQNWVNSALQFKHMLETDDSIIYLPYSPSHCNFLSLPTVLKYKNKYKFDKSEKSVLANIINSNYKNKEWYSNPAMFSEFDKSMNLDNQFINLSDLLDINKLIPTLTAIFDYFELGQLNENLITDMHKIYTGNHESIFPQL